MAEYVHYPAGAGLTFCEQNVGDVDVDRKATRTTCPECLEAMCERFTADLVAVWETIVPGSVVSLSVEVPDDE